MNWPENPYPESIFPMTDDEYVRAVPDEKMRTAISGFLMRKGWEVAERQFIKVMTESTHVCAEDVYQEAFSRLEHEDAIDAYHEAAQKL